MTTEADRPLAQFQRIAQVIRQRIIDGQYPVGSQLPSIASLARELSCSHMTVKQALATLSSEGAISSRRGVRAEVVSVPTRQRVPSMAERLSRVEAQINALTQRLDKLEDHAD